MQTILRCAALLGVCWLLGCDEPASTSEQLPSGATTDPTGEPSKVADGRPWENAADWPRFLGPNSDGKSPEVGLSATALQDVAIQFELPLGEGYATVAVSDGKLFAFDRVDQLARLRCCDARSGEQQWEFTYETDYRDLYGYDGGPRAQPVVDGARVYIYGAEGMLHCLDTTQGRPLWKRHVSREYDVVQNFFGVGSCPFVYEDLLIVMVGGSDKASLKLPPGALDRVRGNGSGLVAFDKRTGEPQWRLSDELASYSSPVVYSIDGRPVGLAFMRGGLLAFDPRSGRQHFFFPWQSSKLESVNASNPVVVGDQVFLSEAYGPGAALLKITADGYELLWKDDPRQRRRAMQTHWNTAIHVDGYLYGSSGRHRGDAELRCIEWATGEVQWSQPGLTRSSLLYVDGCFICLGEDGTLYQVQATPAKYDAQPARLRSANGEKLAAGATSLTEPAWAAPVLSHGLLYLRGRGKLICLPLAAKPDQAELPTSE